MTSLATYGLSALFPSPSCAVIHPLTGRPTATAFNPSREIDLNSPSSLGLQKSRGKGFHQLSIEERCSKEIYGEGGIETSLDQKLGKETRKESAEGTRSACEILENTMMVFKKRNIYKKITTVSRTNGLKL